MIMNSKYKKVWMNAAITYLVILCHHLLSRLRKTMKPVIVVGSRGKTRVHVYINVTGPLHDTDVKCTRHTIRKPMLSALNSYSCHSS
jgi:hypothetical protein